MRVEKLVGIRANLKLFEPDTEPSSTRLDSDTEEEEEEEEEECDVDEAQEEQKCRGLLEGRFACLMGLCGGRRALFI